MKICMMKGRMLAQNLGKNNDDNEGSTYDENISYNKKLSIQFLSKSMNQSMSPRCMYCS